MTHLASEIAGENRQKNRYDVLSTQRRSHHDGTECFIRHASSPSKGIKEATSQRNRLKENKQYRDGFNTMTKLRHELDDEIPVTQIFHTLSWQ
jgi:hypothetical protein